jgi:hypothetical protein
MRKQPERGVIGSLPRTRPHRRSDKRPAAPARPTPDRSVSDSHGPVETAVQAAAELAEIGLHVGARALRRAVSRLPRP